MECGGNCNSPFMSLRFSVQVSILSLMFAFSHFLSQNANILVQQVLNLQKKWSESVFWKKNYFSDGNQNLPYKTLKFKVSMFSLMFVFSRFLAPNANILVQPVLNLQKNWSESVFWKKSCISDGNHNLPYKTLKFKVSMFSIMFAFSRFLSQNANILVQPVLNLQKNWSESVFWKKSCISDGNHNLPYKTLKFKVSMVSIMFAFSRFLSQNANILVQAVLNPQNCWSD